MKIRKEELKKQGKTSTKVNEITEGDMIQAFGVTEDQMQKTAEILGKDENSKKLGKFIILTSKRVWTWELQWQCRDNRKGSHIHTIREYKRYYN